MAMADARAAKSSESIEKGEPRPEEMEVPTCRRRCELEIASHVVSDPCAGGVDDYKRSELGPNGSGRYQSSDLDWILFGVLRALARAWHRAD